MEVVKKNHTDYILSLSDKTDIDENELYKILDSKNENIIDWKSVNTHYEKSDNAIGLFLKGIMHYHGYELVTNHDKAKKLFELAIEKDSVNSMYWLGEIYYEKHVCQEFNKAFDYYMLAKDKGLIEAIYKLGIMYANGYGTSFDTKEATKYFKISAHNGNSDALIQLAKIESYIWMYTDIPAAVKYYEMAVEKGNSHAMYELAEIYFWEKYKHCKISDITKAIKYYVMVDGKYLLCASARLSYIYNSDKYGVTNKKKAKQYNDIIMNSDNERFYEFLKHLTSEHWTLGYDMQKYYFKYIELGAKKDIKYIEFLAHIYHEGSGVNIDYIKAMEYYRILVEQNDYHSIMCLGNMYYRGQGCDSDINKALELFESALKICSDDIDSIIYTGSYFTESSSTDFYPFAIKCFEKAIQLSNYDKNVINDKIFSDFDIQSNKESDQILLQYYIKCQKYLIKQNDPNAMFSLGFCYSNGYGCEADICKAIKYYAMSIESKSYSIEDVEEQLHDEIYIKYFNVTVENNKNKNFKSDFIKSVINNTAFNYIKYFM